MLPFIVHVWYHGVDVHPFVMAALRQHPVMANPILPTLEKVRSLERNGVPVHGHYWCAVSLNGPSPSLLCLVAVTDTYMGTAYPAFTFTPIPPAQISAPDSIMPNALQTLVDEMRRAIPIRRVYSFFGLYPVSRMITRMWSIATGIPVLVEPYYDSTLSFLPLNWINTLQQPVSFPYDVYIGPARPQDLEGVAALCHLFAEEPPFQLTPQGAHAEATLLVTSNLVWVFVERSHVVSIVAFTRNTTAVATITKVVTDPNFRGLRAAEHLTRAVCRFLLSQPGRQTVALFVGVDNAAASVVYQRVGFVGVGRNAIPHPGADRWVEYGFDTRFVDLGHW